MAKAAHHVPAALTPFTGNALLRFVTRDSLAEQLTRAAGKELVRTVRQVP